MIERMRSWFEGQVKEVPNSIAVCEFNCHKSQCSLREWLTCENRLKGPESLSANHGAMQDDPWPAKKKASVVLEVLKNARTPAQACEIHGIKESHLRDWTAQFLAGGEQGLATQRLTEQSETDSRELERLINLIEKRVAGEAVPPSNVWAVSQGRGWWLWMLIGGGLLILSYLGHLL